MINICSGCGLYTCDFAEHVCRGDRKISKSDFKFEYFRLRFGALMWEYRKMKTESDSVSEDEALDFKVIKIISILRLNFIMFLRI